MRRIHAGIRTANAVKPMMEVMNHPQALSGSRISDMPLHRMSSVVVMKLSEPSNWPIQKIPIEAAHRTTPRPCPGPPTAPTALSGAYCVQPPRVGPSGTKNAATITRKATNVTQNDIMLKCGKGMSCASLNGQEEVAEGRKGRRREHKEDHDGSMHGHQLQVVLGGHYVARSACAGKQVQARDREISPAEVNTHEPGKKHPHDRRDQS